MGKTFLNQYPLFLVSLGNTGADVHLLTICKFLLASTTPVSGETSLTALLSIREQIEKRRLITLGCTIITQYQTKKETIMIKNNVIKKVLRLPSFPKQSNLICYMLFSPVGKSWYGRWRTKAELPIVTVV